MARTWSSNQLLVSTRTRNRRALAAAQRVLAKGVGERDLYRALGRERRADCFGFLFVGGEPSPPTNAEQLFLGREVASG